FYIRGRGWIEVKDLYEKDRSVTMSSVKNSQRKPNLVFASINSSNENISWAEEIKGTLGIAKIEQIHRADKVYNIEVENDHTYFVTKGEMLVHNYPLTGTNSMGLGETLVNLGKNIVKNIMGDNSEIDLKNGAKVPYKNSKITSKSGQRVDPVTKKVAQHGGLDYAIPKGTEVRVVEDGEVVRAEGSTKNDKQAVGTKAYGAFIEVKHSNGISTLYAHNSKLLVSPGQKIKAGDVIALSGNSGKSIGKNGGYHLHYEVRQDGKKQNPLTYGWYR
ncbi:MAG: M23 family metallopeptidase, partial [Leptospiraceae bacterium]|nr:M23 family metallopeptidase [Leptospiraceae bacterium]